MQCTWYTRCTQGGLFGGRIWPSLQLLEKVDAKVLPYMLTNGCTVHCTLDAHTLLGGRIWPSLQLLEKVDAKVLPYMRTRNEYRAKARRSAKPNDNLNK